MAIAPEQRPSHGNVMEHLHFRDPLRLVELAEAAGMTPQSMSELVDQLEEMGHVERRPDPADRRAKLIYRTQRGREVSDAATRELARIEAELSQQLGAERLQLIREGLMEILAARGQTPLPLRTGE